MIAAAPSLTAREPLLTRAFALAWVAQFLHATAIHLQIHLPGLLADFGAGEVVIGQTSAAFAIAALVAYPVVGWLMDWKGRRVVILGGGALHVIVAVLHLTLDSMGPWVFILRALCGISEAMIFASLIAYSADIVPESRRTEGLALFGLSGLFPLALGGGLGDLIGSYQGMFIVQTALASVALLASVPLKEHSVTRSVEAGAGSFLGFFSVLFQRRLLPVWFVGFMFAASLTPVFSFVKTLVLERGIGGIGAFTAGYAVVAALTRIFGGRLPGRIGMKRVLVPALWVLGGGLFVLGNAHTVAALVVAGSLCGFGHGFAFPIGLSMAVSRAPIEDRGGAVAIYTAVFPLGMLLAPVFGELIEAFGYEVAFGAAALLPALGSLLFAFWDHRVARAFVHA